MIYRKRILISLIIFLIIWIPFQNTVLAFLVTNTSTPHIIIRFLHILKELLISVAGILSIIFYGGKIKKSLPAQVALLGIYIVLFYGLITYLLTINEAIGYSYVKSLKQLIFPFFIFLIAYLIPFGKRTIRLLVCITIILSLIGLGEILFLPNSFYKNYLNVQKLRKNIKNLPTYSTVPDGIAPNQRPRDSFSHIFYRRASSTYLTPLAYGHAMLPGLLLFLLVLMKNKLNLSACFYWIIFIFAFSGWFFAFTRSSWIVFAVTFFCLGILSDFEYIQILAIMLLVFVILFLFYPRLQHFVLMKYVNRGNFGRHFKALKDFYIHTLSNLDLVIGGGIDGRIIKNPVAKLAPDCGYMMIFNQMGWVGLGVYFLWFLSIIKHTVQSLIGDMSIGLVMGTIIVLNFGGYIFGGTFYFFTFLIWGYSVDLVRDNQNERFFEDE